MIKLLYFYSKMSPLNSFLLKQLEEANINREDVIVEIAEDDHETIERYNLSSWHTTIIEDSNGKLLARKEGAFNSKDIELLVEKAKKTKKIYVILGKTCSGKTTLLKRLKNKGYRTVVSYTTRPKRPNEIHDEDYHFVSNETFCNLDKASVLLAKNSFEVANGDTWKYGIHKLDLLESGTEKVIVITEPNGYRDLVKNLPDADIISIYLDIDLETRFARGNLRSGVSTEMIRRFAQDEEDFKDFEKIADHIITDGEAIKVEMDVIKILGEAC